MTQREKIGEVPTWSGEIELFDSYKVKVKYFLRTKPEWQKSQQLARLIQGLRGKAWDLIERLPESSKEKLESSEEVLFGFLKKHLLEGEIPELGRCFKSYLTLKRQKRESMVLYCMRHRVCLDKLANAMRIVEGQEIQIYLENRIKGIRGFNSSTDSDSEEDEDEEEDWDEQEEEEDPDPPPAPKKIPRPTGRTWGVRDPRPPDLTSEHGSLKSKKSSGSKRLEGLKRVKEVKRLSEVKRIQVVKVVKISEEGRQLVLE